MQNIDEVAEFPYVAKVVDIGLGDGVEILHCELVRGEKYEVDLHGTSLQGFGSSIVFGGGVYEPEATPFYAAFGRKADGSLYMEPLFTADEFAKIPDHCAVLDSQSASEYADWLLTHLISPDISPEGFSLHYGYTGSIFTYPELSAFDVSEWVDD